MAQWLQENPEVCERTWFSDEAHFWLCGHVNSRNAVYWSDKRPDKVLHKPLHSTKVTVWAAMRQGQPPIGPSSPAWNPCRGIVVPTRRRDPTYGQCHNDVATDTLPWETHQPEDGGAVAVGPPLAGPVTGCFHAVGTVEVQSLRD